MTIFVIQFKLCLPSEVVLGGSLVRQQTLPNLAGNPRACNYVNHCLCSTHWSNRCTEESQKQCQQQSTHSSHEESSTEWARSYPRSHVRQRWQVDIWVHTYMHKILIHLGWCFSSSHNRRKAASIQLLTASLDFLQPLYFSSLFTLCVFTYNKCWHGTAKQAALSNNQKVPACAVIYKWDTWQGKGGQGLSSRWQHVL